MRKKQSIAIFVGLLLGLIGLAVGIEAALGQASAPNRVGLLVVHGNGLVIKRCIEFSEPQITGYEVLEYSGLDLNVDVTNGTGSAICRIDNEGCTYPEEECFCQCSGGSACVFWSYWHLINGQWQFSQMGAGGYNVSNGEVEGWLWGGGTAEGAAQPPVINFDEICPPLSTATPTPTHTPTLTPLPTDTPEPTDTATPLPPPVIHHFTAAQSAVDAGQSVTLSWDLSGADAAYLRYDGVEEGVVSPGSKTVSPEKTMVYTLVARNDGGETSAEITITVNAVNAVAAAPSPTTQPSPPAPLPAPVDTDPPTPVIEFLTAASTLPMGACTSLYWEVENVTAVYVDGVQVAPHGSQQACPQQTQTYTLLAVYPGGEKSAQLELVVIEATNGVKATNIAADASTGPAASPATLTATPSLPVPPTPEATQVSQNVLPALETRLPQARRSTDEAAMLEEGSWGWTCLGIWGTLVGGWCLIGLAALAVFGGVWWLNSRKRK
ncbi:MAG: hypothetical protein JW953_21135 [Anaerolineae bacterium]|nr:hypothetical protein [Anaerolineae bacterium]